MKHSVKTEQLLSLITCVLMVAAVSLRRDGKLLGHELTTKNRKWLPTAVPACRKTP